MATVAQAAEQATELLQNLTLESEAKSADVSEAPKQPAASEYGVGETANGIPDASGTGPSVDRANTPVLHDLVMDPNMFYYPNGYAHQAYYYGGYDGPMGEWEDYPRYVNTDGVEIPAPGVYGDNGSVLYHPGFGYVPPVPYGPYSPAGTPVPTMGADGQLYGPQPFQYTGPFYQQPVPPGAHYVPSPTPPLPQPEVSTSGATEQGTLSVDSSNGNGVTVNGNGVTLCPRPAYPMALLPSNGSYGRGILPTVVPSSGYHDAVRSGAPWLDAQIASEGQSRSVMSNAVSSVVTQTASSPAPLGQNVRPVSHIMPHFQGVQHPRPPSGIGPAPGFMNRAYPSNRMYPYNNNAGRSSPGFGANGFDYRSNGRGWIAVDKSKPRGRGNGFTCNNNEILDVLNEQNRGPRTARFRNQRTGSGSAWPVKGQSPTSNGNSEDTNVIPNRDQYNRPEFPTKYSDAKFFIIKSYSEDDIHKSIKYNVWASTPNGNKKLDAAYKESHETAGYCPVFLFFSVNASGQFCGVAEMVEPVDFNQSVDYWQQDKWTGRFLVKWHIVKDVPNSQLRHITLENNDNKPVTNSRDTQEVKFEQGIEMLRIFKDYVSKTSILDDFMFYEGRQKAMQEKRARQQMQHQQQLRQVAYRPGNEIDQAHSEDSVLKAWDGKTGETAFDDKDVKSRVQKPTDLTKVANSTSDIQHHGLGQGNADHRSSEEMGVSTGVGDAPKDANPTTGKWEPRGDAVDKLLQSNGC